MNLLIFEVAFVLNDLGWTGVIFILIAVALGGLRLSGVKSQAFQAVAHLYVGGLIGAYAAGGDGLYLALAVVLTVVEVIAFLWFRLASKAKSPISPR